MPIEEEVLNAPPEEQESNSNKTDSENHIQNNGFDHGGDREPPLNTSKEQQGGAIKDTITDTIEETVGDTVTDTIGETQEPHLDDGEIDPELAAALAGEIEVEEEEGDPLDDVIIDNPEPPKENPQETLAKATGESQKNYENLERIAGIGLDWLDGIKSNACSKMSGEQPAIFAADQKQTKALIEAGKEWFKTMEVKAPTAAGTFALALIAYLGAPFVSAFAFKKGLIPSIDPVYKETQEERQPIKDTSKYKDLKEVKQGRKNFKIFTDKGTYRTTPKGTFSKKAVSNEKPSPEVMDMIQDGKTNEEIREVLYG